MTLNYYVAPCLTDSPAFSIREKTKKAVTDTLLNRGFVKTNKGDWWSGEMGFGEIRKVTVNYDDELDLLKQCLSEGGIHED